MDPHVEEENGRRCGCCCCLKYCIFYLLTFLIWIGGVILLAIGIYYFAGFEHLEDVTGVTLTGVRTAFMWPAIYFIVVGSLRFIACFIGCCGSIKSSTCLLKSFLIVLTVVFIIELIVEISMAVLAFTAQDYIKDYLNDFISPWVKEYTPDPEGKDLMLDNLQARLKCCGYDKGPADYELNPLYKCRTDPPGQNACSVPDSCCITKEDNCGRGMMAKSVEEQVRIDTIYTQGCVGAMMDAAQLQNNLLIIGLTLLGIMLVMLFTIIFGFCILRHVSNRESNEGTDVRMDLLKSEREYDA